MSLTCPKVSLISSTRPCRSAFQGFENAFQVASDEFLVSANILRATEGGCTESVHGIVFH